ncbi:DNA adenine methylase [Polaromonas sp.]|uniref:DNA adenine methylase n=1 Tax=Polaromonas sp. TaxID=1869339 RepID=UPI003BB5BD3D
MTNNHGNLAAPFPYFGGKSGAAAQVWAAFGKVDNYVEAFAGSAAMLLAAPDQKRIETINDSDGFVANFWRAIAHDPDAVAHAADWPCNEVDLFARHSWLVRQSADLTERLHADPDYYDSKIAGWWCWGACNWIGSGWCSGTGPWVHDGNRIINSRQLPHLGNSGRGINRQLPHLGDAGRGINRQLPHLGDAGQGINRETGGLRRSEFIHDWFSRLHDCLRDVRVTCGDWSRVVKDSVTTRHGLTAVFLDPPYAKGAMDYAVGGVGTDLPLQVQAWCASSGADKNLRIVLCGHAGEHDALLAHGWTTRKWTARKGYALSDDARDNTAGETLWCSPHCVPELTAMGDLFAQ